MAVKWLGNGGSHSVADAKVENVLVAYEILEVVLSEVFGVQKKILSGKINKINAQKGRV